MKAITIEGVRCTRLSKTKLQLELPSGMTGLQLRKWQEKNKAEALKVLDVEETNVDPLSYVPE